MADNRALVLIPCSAAKASRPSTLVPVSPIEGILPLRKRMIELTGDITSGAAVPAVSLYNGALYKQCRGRLEAVASGFYPEIDLLIVSAYYGLLHPAEPISCYNLSMDSEVEGNQVYRLWQWLRLGAVLEGYVGRRKISNIWSLLSYSHGSPYRQALNPFWKEMSGKVISWQVTVEGDGQNNPYRRGQWLEQVLMALPEHLVEEEPVPDSIMPHNDSADSHKRPIQYLRI